ncbi:MAG: hypothetical protein Q9227_004043 [Pyrenula ochraceoflavens]
MLSFLATLLATPAALTVAQQVAQDSLTAGPPLEAVHYYYDEWPTGIAVSASGRKFSNYPPGLDPTIKNYTVAELTGMTTETPYPSLEMNSPPGGRINYTTNPASVVIDPADRLWILDTGRVALDNGTLLTAAYGGPKLIGVDLTTNSVIQTILFPPSVAFPDSYLNDIRFDLRPDLSDTAGKGVGYITDSSSEGRNGIIIVDLGSGESWRHLNGVPSVRPEGGFFVSVWGEPVYSNPGNGQPITPLTFGVPLSSDGLTLYYSPVSSRTLYSVPTSTLRSRTPTSELLAQSQVLTLTQKGVSDGLETDSNALIYAGSVETNSIVTYNPLNNTVQTFVRDPRIDWTDTFSVAEDGYVYFTENQLWRGAAQQGGVDRRIKPYVLFRAKCPGGGGKVMLM